MNASFSTTTATTGATAPAAVVNAGGGSAREVGVVSPRVALPQTADLMERPRPGLTGHPPALTNSAFVPHYGRLPGVHGYGSLRPPPPPPAAYGWLPSRLSGDSGEEYDRAVQRYSRAHADLALRQHWLHTFRQNNIRCTSGGCACTSFTPGEASMRVCQDCSHGWIQHALDKLGRQAVPAMQPEPVTPAAIFDLAALILFGCQAVPIRLKILLDKLFSKLAEEDVAQILRAFGWSREEYVQGYIKDGVWTKCSPEEEPLILQQFMRFEETRPIAFEFLQKDEKDGKRPPLEPDMKKLVERVQPFLRPELLQRPGLCLPGLRLPAAPFPHPVSSPSNGAFGPPPQLPPPPPPAQPPASVASALSPLNKLQSMQPTLAPFERRSPDGSLDLSRPAAVSSAPSLPPPPPPSSSSVPPISSAMNLTTMATSEPLRSPIEPPSALNLTASAMELEKRARKALTPIKRRGQWDPIGPNPTALVNPVTGKKRVQCHACLKTFCDKGALKIHFSAVHLKEMHKCSVDGCTMMFSSRRSRNRHSANPNPKLHTPHMRRKISPHDGRMSQSHGPVGLPPTLPPGFPHPGLLSGFNPLTGLPMLPSPELQKQALESLHSSLNTLDLARSQQQFMMPGGMPGGIPESINATMSRRLEQYQEEMRRRGLLEAQRDDESGKRYKSDSNDDRSTLNDDDADGSVDNQSFNGEVQINGQEEPQSKRKRKSQNPIKFSVRIDEDDIHMSSDDSSLDDLPDDEDDKDDDEDDEELKNLKSEDDSADEKETESDPPRQPSFPSFPMVHDTSVSSPKNGERPGMESCDRPESPRADVGPPGEHTTQQQESFDALKRLESLSKSNFGDFLGKGPMDQPAFPPTSLSMGLHEPTPLLVKPEDEDCSAPGKDKEGSVKEDDEGDMSDGDSSLSLSPACSPSQLEEGYFSNAEIPIDKENPRRCIVCGKMFQNHFGVKTHYQNVHLKVMHKCTIDGCKAKFPSKRSRDRHSSNYNLHRKLLSTSSSSESARQEAAFPSFPTGWGGEYLARLCGGDPAMIPLGLPGGLPDGTGLRPHPMLLQSLMHPALAANYQASLVRAGAPHHSSRSPSPQSPPHIKENNNEALAKVS